MSPRELHMVLPVPPRLNSRYIYGAGKVILGSEDRLFRQTVEKECMVRHMKPFQGDVEVNLVWYRAAKRGDVDGRIPSLLNALKGFAYNDDKQVWKLTIERSDEDPKNPRMLVHIKEKY